MSTTVRQFVRNTLLFSSAIFALVFAMPQSALAATASVTASPSTVVVGEQITVTWSSSDAWKCVGTGFNTGDATSGSVNVTQTTTGTKTFSVTCYDETPACTLQLLETTIDDGPAGNTCNSIIDTSPLGSCSPNGGFCSTSSSQGNGFYQNRTWQCLGSCTTASASDTATVNDPPPPPPNISISVSPTTVTQGNSVLVSWNANNASSCDGTNFSTNGATSGSVSVTPTADTTYSITCDSTIQTTGTPGTWELNYTDVTDLWCPITSTIFNNTYNVYPNCPTSSVTPSCPPGSTFGCTHTNTGDPTGLACTGSERCKLNSNTSCNIVSEIYQCNGGSEPAQISESTSVDYNGLPNAPSISGPTTGVAGTTYTFTFDATDPDGDTIRYRADWDDNGTVDQNVPSSGYVSSGTSRTATRSWSTAGTYTFKVRTQDSPGAQSGWTSHTITINPSTPAVSGSCSASPASIQTGESTTWSASPSGGTGSYSYSWSGTDSLSGSTQNVGKTYITSGNKTGSVTITSGADNININCSTTVVVTAAPPDPQCSDGVNNDGDAWTDYPNDPGCSDANDDSEGPNPQCSDGVDNDGDGDTDYPADSDCSGNGGTNEGSGPQPNQAPSTPTISGVTSGITNTNYGFSFVSTDPDGDGVRIRIDWNPNSGIDQNKPSSGYGPSGSTQFASHSWSSPGNYQFRVLAEDDQGAQSSYRYHSISISAPECSDGSDNDSDSLTDYPNDPGCSSSSDNNEYNAPMGPANLTLTLAPDTVVRSGDSVSVSWSATSVQWCDVSGSNGDYWTGTSGNRTSSALTTETTFVLECTDLSFQTINTAQTIRIVPAFDEI